MNPMSEKFVVGLYSPQIKLYVSVIYENTVSLLTENSVVRHYVSRLPALFCEGQRAQLVKSSVVEAKVLIESLCRNSPETEVAWQHTHTMADEEGWVFLLFINLTHHWAYYGHYTDII